MKPTPQEVLALDNETFTQIVDRDIRGEAPDHAEALRSPEVVNRWIAVLSGIQKSVEGQLAARSADFEALKKKLRVMEHSANSEEERDRLDLEFLTAAERYEKGRGGTLRFKTGVEQKLIEAQYLRDSYEPKIKYLRDERDELIREVYVLRTAILEHRTTILAGEYEHSEIDEKLWAHLPAERID